MIEACEAYYLHGKSQKEIAEALGVSTASVSRLLRYARDTGIVRVTIHPPRDVILARKVLQLLADTRVREVIVAPNGKKAVGQMAARYIEEMSKPGCTVVLDGGYTVAEFVDGLGLCTLSQATIIPVATDPPSYNVSSFELMTRMAGRIQQSTCLKLPYASSEFLDPFFQKARTAARQADFAFLGAGPWSHGFTALEFLGHLGADPGVLKKKIGQIVAVSAYHPLDASGQRIVIPMLDTLRYALDFEDFQALARSANAHVCLLAAGAQKAEAIRAVTFAGMCNTCILDEELAAALLEQAGQPVGMEPGTS
jgi:deoxyribonucleoside regulator